LQKVKRLQGIWQKSAPLRATLLAAALDGDDSIYDGVLGALCTEGVEAGTVEADQLSVAERGYPRPVFDEGLPGHAVPPSLALTECNSSTLRHVYLTRWTSPDIPLPAVPSSADQSLRLCIN
jgi:hypothetical protein